MQEGMSLSELRRSITQDQINRYAEISGDHNPVHIDAEFANKSMFGRIVAHGMMVLGLISEMLTVDFGQDWLDRGRLKVRFRSPVYPGDLVSTTGKITGITSTDSETKVECTVGCINGDGEYVITGEASVTLNDIVLNKG